MSRKKQIARQKRLREQEISEQINIKAKQKRNKILTTLASIGTALVLGYSSLNYFSRDFKLENAKEHPEARQAYLESLVSSNDIPYSKGIVYDSDGKKMLEDYRNLISTIETNPVEIELALKKVTESMKDPNTPIKTPEIFDISGQGIKPPIYVNRLLFEDKTPIYESSKDIAHIIKYHEGRHAEQFSRGLKELGYLSKEEILEGINNGQIMYQVLYGLGEVDALNNELLAIESGKSKVSKKYYTKTLNEYQKGRHTFEEISNSGSSLQQKLIKKILENNPKR